MTARGQQPAAPPLPYVPGEILVKFRQDSPTSRRNAAMDAQSAQLIRRFDAIDLHHLRLRPGQTVEAALAAFRANPDVLSAQPNYIRYVAESAPPNDPYWLDDTLWGLRRVLAQAAWTNFTTGDGTVVIADIDTGVNYNHPDLAANIWTNPGEIPGNGIDDDHNGYVDDVHGIDTVNRDSDPMDDHGHGTHTAGTLGAVGNNGIGVVGVNWNAKILACKFIAANGSGSDAGAIECFNYITALKNRGINIRVSSNSWGAQRDLSQPFPTTFKSAIDAAGNAGILNVFAAGNSGTDNDVAPFDPASFTSSSIVSVAASDSGDNRASFSNYGLVSVDLAAPGVSIRSTYGSGYADLSGTSMATPHVAGAAALLFAQKPILTASAAKALLLDNVDRLGQWTSAVASGGRLNVFAAALANSPNIPPAVSITAPANNATLSTSSPITVTATASDSDGTVSSVAFYANGVLIGLDTASPYSISWSPSAGSYTLTAVATDNLGASTTSAAIGIVVQGRVNVALAANGGTALASGTYSPNYPASSVINGDRKGLSWDAGGGWLDTASPDWLEIDFSGPKTIDEVDVFSLQDNPKAPSDPTPTMTFTTYGVTDFEVQYWTGSQWMPVPLGSVSGNNLVWRRVPFAALTTSRIRVWITGVLNGASRVVEVEAYQPGTTAPPTVTLTSPANNATLVAPATVSLAATATDSDGTVTSVDFYANGTWLGSDTTSPYTFTWTNVGAGQYTLTAIATDSLGATTVSAPVTITASLLSSGRINVALASNGGTAFASSTYNSNYPASSVIDGDRKGSAWDSGGGWLDATSPDWLEVDFNGTKTIDEVDVFSLQDTPKAPIDPTPTMTFATYGVTDFQLQYWTGTQWVPVPFGTVSANNLVWRRIPFAAVSTSKIRVFITGALNGASRLVEVEAYQPAPTAPPAVTLTSPSNNAIVPALAMVPLTANATDSDGAVTSVDFYVNGSWVGSDLASPYTLGWTNSGAGSYTLTAIATDDSGATAVSAPVNITVADVTDPVNVALAANGATAFASSTYNSNYPASSAIDGDRKGAAWDAGGGWLDATENMFPDWLEVDFAGVRTITEVDVFSLQDTPKAPVDPTPAMTFSKYGLTDFEVQYWTGTQWVVVPGGTVSGNTLVWRQIVFAALDTSRIRIWITGALNGNSRMVEVEAYQQAGGITSAPLTSP
jgi:hypothetical protein